MEDVAADRVLLPEQQQGTLPASSAAAGGAGNSLHPPPPPHGPDPDSEIRDDELEEPSEVSHISNHSYEYGAFGFILKSIDNHILKQTLFICQTEAEASASKNCIFFSWEFFGKLLSSGELFLKL